MILAAIVLYVLAAVWAKTVEASQPPAANTKSAPTAVKREAASAADKKSVPATGDFSFDKCRDAWQRRERASQYLRLSWDQTESIPKGMFPLDGYIPNRKGRKGAAIPAADTLLSGRFAVVFSGEQVRYEEDAEAFSPDLNQPYRAHDVRLFSHGRYVAYFDKSVVRHSVGDIEPRARNKGVVRERNILPLMLFFRMLDQEYGRFALNNVEIEPNSIVVDGSRCRVLRQPISEALTHELCIDVDRDYIPLRYSTYENGRLSSQCSVTRVSNPIPGLLAPGEWTISRFRPDGQVVSEVRGVQKSCEVPSSVSDVEFELDFPAGTWVIDNIARRQYVIQKSGLKRDVPVGAGERQYEWLMDPVNNGSTTSATETKFGPFSARVWVLLALNGVGLLLVISFFVHRARRSA